MALLTYSSPVGTSASTTSTIANDTSRSISTTTTTNSQTTLTNKTTTTTTTTLSNKSSATTTTATFLAHITSILFSSTLFKTLYQTHLLFFSLLFSTLTLLLLQLFSLLQSVLQLLALASSFATKLFVYKTLLLLRNITMETASLTYSIWDSHKARQIRKKIEFEFFVWILGPGGNLLCFLLWPGWIVLAVMIWGMSCLMTGLLSSGAVMPVSG